VIKQYQELLNGKLNLEKQLAITGIFDAPTKAASTKYICSPFLVKKMSSLLAQDAQIGFKGNISCNRGN